jgi:hypothetical protein
VSSSAERKMSWRWVATTRVVLSEEKFMTWNLTSAGIVKLGTVSIVCHC